MKKKITVFTLCAMLFALSYSASAQQPNKVPRIGFLGNSTEALEANLVGPFRQGLRELGYVEGQPFRSIIAGPRVSMNASLN